MTIRIGTHQLVGADGWYLWRPDVCPNSKGRLWALLGVLCEDENAHHVDRVAGNLRTFTGSIMSCGFAGPSLECVFE